jgi:hypothetical protein
MEFVRWRRAAWMVGFLVLGAAPGQSQTCAPVAIDCLEPVAVNVAPGAHFAYGASSAGDLTSGDAWVARYDGERKEPTWRVTIAGTGDDRISTVTLSRRGELLVVGSTTSPYLAGFSGRSRGRRDGFVARLDLAGGRLLGGTFLGGAGDDELHGVVATADGRIHVVGVGGQGLGSSGTAPAVLTRIELPSPTAASQPAFLTTYDATLSRVTAQQSLGSLRVKRPRVWVDCQGNLVVGIVAMMGGCNGGWPNLVYEQDQIAEDYDLDHDWADPNGWLGFPPGGWGYHALRWKEYQANSFTPGWQLNLTTNSPNEVPKWSSPSCSEAGTLNNLETFYFTQSGTPADPPGGWTCGNHGDLGQLSLLAAHFFQRWGTPVYTQFGSWNTMNDPWVWNIRPVAVERATFEPFCPFDPNAYSGQTIDDLCDLDVNSANDLTCTTSSGIPGIDGPGFFLRLDSFQGAVWSLPLTWWSRLTGWDPQYTWTWEEWYTPGEYVMDPPDGGGGADVLTAAARQSAGRIVRSSGVQVTRSVAGVDSCKSVEKAVIPAGE